MSAYYSDSSRGRPDRALRVECTFDRKTKRIRFNSCGNCSLARLRKKESVEEAFSELRALNYGIHYKDDDGEISDIASEYDLTEAITYFQAGLDDVPVSSGSSILSGFSGGSFGARQYIIIQVNIVVDYDGRLSDTSSLAPSDEFGDRRRSMDSYLYGSLNGPLDDDQITISSKDRSVLSQPAVTREHASGAVSLDGDSQHSYLARDEQQALQQQYYYNQNRDSFASEISSRPPSGVFAQIRHLENRERYDNFNPDSSLTLNHRGAAWLAEQNRIAKESMLGMKPTASEIGRGSIRLSMDSVPPPFTPDGDLALERDRKGKFYYSYTSSVSSQSHNGHAQDFRYRDSMTSSSALSLSRAPSGNAGHRHSAPMHHPLPPIPEPTDQSGSASSSEARGATAYTPQQLKELQRQHPDIPPELLVFEDTPAQLTTVVSECSSCGSLLDTIRYVCASCGPRNKSDSDVAGKGKTRELDGSGSETSSSPGLRAPNQWSSNSSASRSSQTLVIGNGQPQDHGLRLRTSMASLGISANGTPNAPSPASTLHSPGSAHSHGSANGMIPMSEGYELCGACIESVGVVHALDAGLTASVPSPGLAGDNHALSPSDSHRSFSEWKRSAPRTKGQLRHAYLEQLLGPDGWQTICAEDEAKPIKCSTCNNTIRHQRYKCLSCHKFNLCKSCYSQVHEIHPSHVFLEVTNDKEQAKSEPDSNGHTNEPIVQPGPGDEQSLSHGVKCAHCMLEIIGARFHCAICDDIDICFNCESAGLPGDLDSAEGGHSSKHIMIKIPVPLETNKVESLSRQTVHLWTGRDAPHLGDEQTRLRDDSGSVHSNLKTIIAPHNSTPSLTRAVVDGETNNHNLLCDNCEEVILGIRYQCASCISTPTSYNLCEQCEPRSYIVHNPMHIFFKLPRPVHRPLQSERPFVPSLYKQPAGPAYGNPNHEDPTKHLQSLLHLSVACDLCIERIQGAWYWCVYCGKDLCHTHEEMDTHDNTHVFVVFKGPIDMQAFKRFAETDSNPGQPRVIPYPVYLA